MEDNIMNQKECANALRFLAADMVEKANSGHPGLPLGMADVMCELFFNHLIFYPPQGDWFERDAFILSAGHGSALLYATLHLCGYKDFTLEELQKFRQLHSHTAGHPEINPASGIETTTGPLGQGIANAIGMAIGYEHFKAHNPTARERKTYVLCGDGDLMEGVALEAISLAGHLNLKNLIVLYDDNSITIDGTTDLSRSENTLEKFNACSWDTMMIDGHDFSAIHDALNKAKQSDKPCLIACKTTIGYGAPTKQGTHHVHGSPLGNAEIQAMRENLNWNYSPFEIPEEIRGIWSQKSLRHQDVYAQSQFKNGLPHSLDLNDIFSSLYEKIINLKPHEASRVSSQKVLEHLMEQEVPLFGGSADLTPSNNTHTKFHQSFSKDHYQGNYIHYGVREHAMASIMNGISLVGNKIPYGGTFLVFSDYMRPAMRLSALMERQVIYILTHDSIGLGEDGPTHQPVEHMASLRAIPNLNVFRPANALETAQCWHVALENKTIPSVFALSRQNLDFPKTILDVNKNPVQRGGYVLFDQLDNDQKIVNLIATGSEVSLAMQARDLLLSKGIYSRIISIPCLDIFKKQSIEYQNKVLGKHPRIIIEAAIVHGWEAYIRDSDVFVGLDAFGASAPAKDLFKHFNITTESIVQHAERIL